MKKFAAMVLSMAMLMSISVSAASNGGASGENQGKPSETMTKAEFAEYVKGVAANMPATANVAEQIDKTELLRDYYFDGFTSEEVQKLEEAGIYLYNYQTDEELAQEKSVMPIGTGEPTMTYVMQPAVSYDANADEWTVVAGGEWTDLSWVPFFGGNIGGYECVGYIFDNSNMDTLSSSKKPRIQEVTASLLSVTSNLNREDREVINYNLNVDEDDGVGSYMQDRSLLGGHYIGEHYAIVVVYDYRFENVTGDVKSYYVHTDSGIELTKVELMPVVAGNNAAILPVPTFSNVNYEFAQVSVPLEL